MSRQYDAKNAALKAYPEDRAACIELFYTIICCSEEDFEYEEGRTAEEYLFSDKEVT